MAHICILSGGNSSEREVSLRSGSAVERALQASGHTIVNLSSTDCVEKLVELINSGNRDFDVILPVLHGSGGEDGTLQAKLETLGVAFVGTGSDASRLCFDKWSYREFLKNHGVPLADGQLVSAGEIWQSELVQNPFVLKPHDGGSSIDTFIMRDIQDIPKAQIDEALARHPQMLLEALIPGTEITIAVLGEQALPAIEIIPPQNQEFDYENKYNGATQELCPPQNVADEIVKSAQTLAANVHRATGCRDFSRTDMIVRPDGQLIVLETNTIPGMTDQSLLPKAAATAGIDMPALCDQLVQFALQRKS